MLSVGLLRRQAICRINWFRSYLRITHICTYSFLKINLSVLYVVHFHCYFCHTKTSSYIIELYHYLNNKLYFLILINDHIHFVKDFSYFFPFDAGVFFTLSIYSTTEPYPQSWFYSLKFYIAIFKKVIYLPWLPSLWIVN
jgi:hypothetical protein